MKFKIIFGVVLGLVLMSSTILLSFSQTEEFSESTNIITSSKTGNEGIEQVVINVNGERFRQGEPISIISEVRLNNGEEIIIDKFKTKSPTLPSPCGQLYLDFIFLRGSHEDISSYENLIDLQENEINVKYPHARKTCMTGFHGETTSIKISPSITQELSQQEIINFELSRPGLIDKLFSSPSSPSFKFSKSIETYKTGSGGEKVTERDLKIMIHDITKYYDVEETMEEIGENKYKRYRASHILEPGEYTVVGFTQSGVISEPKIITILPKDSELNTDISSKTSALLNLFSPFQEAYGDWDNVAQGIEVDNTDSNFNEASGEADIFGARFEGLQDAEGFGLQHNAFLSGQITGTNYLWVQNIIFVVADSLNHNTYTCSTWPSGTYTCAYVDKVNLNSRMEFHTDDTGILNTCEQGSVSLGFWKYDIADDACYHIEDDIIEPVNIGLDGKKRFDINLYDKLETNGKVKLISKFRTCTSDLLSSCGAFTELWNTTSEFAMTSSNQHFTSDTFEGKEYATNMVLVGHSGGDIFNTLDNTYIEMVYDATDSGGTPTVDFKRCNSAAFTKSCVLPAESNRYIFWESPIGDTGTQYQFKSSAKYDTPCFTSLPSPGNWNLNNDCTLGFDVAISGNITVDQDSRLLIPNPVNLNVDLSDDYLLVKDGSWVLIADGAIIEK